MKLKSYLLSIVFGFVSTLPLLVAEATGAESQTSITDIPLPLLKNGVYVHANDVVTRLISIGPDGVLLECKTNNPILIWREHFVSNGSQIRLDVIQRPVVVATDPPKVQWIDVKAKVAASGPSLFPAPVPSRSANIGITAVDSRWSNYGVYLQRFIESVQIQWERILSEGGVYPNPGSIVEVKFVLNSKGEVSKILNVHPSAGTSDAATRACPAAIEARSPYGEWTDDMIAMLGNEQQMTFTFLYK